MHSSGVGPGFKISKKNFDSTKVPCWIASNLIAHTGAEAAGLEIVQCRAQNE